MISYHVVGNLECQPLPNIIKKFLCNKNSNHRASIYPKNGCNGFNVKERELQPKMHTLGFGLILNLNMLWITAIIIFNLNISLPEKKWAETK